VLNAVLVDPATGRVAATYPALPGDPGASAPFALPASQVAAVAGSEHPAPPGVTLAQLRSYWGARGVEPALLADLEGIDLAGAVVTPA